MEVILSDGMLLSNSLY